MSRHCIEVVLLAFISDMMQRFTHSNEAKVFTDIDISVIHMLQNETSTASTIGTDTIVASAKNPSLKLLKGTQK